MNNVLLVIIIFLYVREWIWRIKSDGFKEATNAMTFAGIVIAIGFFASTYFGEVAGPLAVLILLITAFIQIFISRIVQEKRVKISLQILILLVSLVSIFNISPLYHCPIEKKWYILGRDATLINQMDGTTTLCHKSLGNEHDTTCHDFVDGFHGLFAENLSQ